MIGRRYQEGGTTKEPGRCEMYLRNSNDEIYGIFFFITDENLTFVRSVTHSHIFKADVSLIPFLALFDSVMLAGTIPSMARARDPKNQKEEQVTPTRSARPEGSVARRMSCWVRVSIDPAIFEVEGTSVS